MKFIDGFNIGLNFHVRETRHLGNIGHTLNLLKLVDNMIYLSYFCFDTYAGSYSKTKLNGICCGNNLYKLFVISFFSLYRIVASGIPMVLAISELAIRPSF